MRISETVSEKRRGRPKAWHANATIDLMSGAKTARGKENWRLAISAMQTLSKAWDPSFAWFWGRDPIATWDEMSREVMARRADWRPTVLTEIGRLLADDARIVVALAIAAMPLDTRMRDAVRTARHCRLGTALAPDLSAALTRTIQEHLRAVPATSTRDVMRALADIYDGLAATTEAAE